MSTEIEKLTQILKESNNIVFSEVQEFQQRIICKPSLKNKKSMTSLP